MAQLVWLTQGSAAPSAPWELTRGVHSLGRHPDENDLFLPGHYVARVHLRFHRDPDGGYRVEEGTSREPSSVNGTRIVGRVRLRDGDVIRMLDYRFAYRETPERDRTFPCETIDGVLVIRLGNGAEGVKSIGWSEIEPDVWKREVVAIVEALPGQPRVVLDFAAVEFLVNGQLGRLIELIRAARSRGGEVVICGLRPELASVLEQLFPPPQGYELIPRAVTLDEAVVRLSRPPR